MENNTAIKVRATILTKPSKKIVDETRGTERVLLTAQITEGKMKGAIVTCTRTVLNSKGETKSVPEIGDEVTLYVDVIINPEDPTKRIMFFQVQMDSLPQTTAMEDLFAMLYS
jgi:uncharacterized membrane protein